MQKELKKAVSRKSAGYKIAFQADITLGNIVAHCFEHRGQLLRVSPSAIPRLFAVAGLSLATSPLRMWERLRWRRSIRDVKLPDDPIFIIGHWRSGTTHLHNLLSKDERYGFITNLQTTLPETFLSFERPGRWLFERLLPQLRPMDNVSLALDAPQEGEIALSKTVPHTFFAHLYNPQDMEQRFESSIFLDSVSLRGRASFNASYLRLVKKVTLRSQGKPLLLKNGANSGRLDLLREVFPNSRFVFIHRNPYDVFNSMKHFYGSLFDMLKVQSTTPEAIESLTLTGYETLHRRYLAERDSIPKSNLIEVSFDDLDKKPLEVAQSVYEHFGTEGFDTARVGMQEYVDSVKEYQRNPFDIPAAALDRINERWGFAFDEWNYSRIESPASAEVKPAVAD